MVSMLPPPKSFVTDTWVAATWDEFLAASQHSEVDKSSGYYDLGWMRIETMPMVYDRPEVIGYAHGKDNSTLTTALTLYGTMRNIPFLSLTNVSFQKAGERECQPDLAFYTGSVLPTIPWTNSPVDVDEYGAPTIVIEIATLSDDLGQKRLLYERLGVLEYWVVNVGSAAVTAFAMRDGGSRQIQVSQVWAGLSMGLIEAALERSRTAEDGAVNRWLMQQFGAI
jgi:Uma2 family endonuclease